MSTRADAAGDVLADLDAFQIDHQLYFDDLEPQAWYDAVLTGKVKGLLAFCRVLGWSELVSSVKGLLPLEGEAAGVLQQVQSFVIPEALERA